VVGVGLFGDGEAAEVVGEAGAVEAALEDLGVGDGAVGAVGIVHAVQGEGCGVEVALGDDAGGVDEVLVVGAAGDGCAVEVGGEAHGPEVGVDDGVGLGQEAGDLGRGVLAQPDSNDEAGDQRQHQEQRVPRPFAH
jgi:hypothetical protein